MPRHSAKKSRGLSSRTGLSQGFTIIEVLIVLAIAGLIMLIVFLAVPALQRNSRNNQRTKDASQILSAVNECLSNRNGQISSCNTDTKLSLDPDKLSLLKTVLVTDTADASVWTNAVDANGSDGSGAGVFYGYKCSADGTTGGADYNGEPTGVLAGTKRQFIVTYRLEKSNGTFIKCLAS